MKKIYLTSITLILHFCIYSQNLESINPASATAGRQDVDVTIKGSGTHFTQGSGTTIDFAFSPGAFLNSFNLVNDTLLIARISIPASTPTGDYLVSVYNSIDGTFTSKFHVTGRPLPIVVSMNPSSANAGQTLDVTIKGTGTHFEQDSTAVFFRVLPGETVTNSVNVINDTVLVANITISPTTYTGNYDVFLYTMDDGTFQFHNFQVHGVTPPTLVSIYPASGNAGQTLTVSIMGDHTHFIANKTSVSVDFKDGKDPLIADLVNVTSDTSLEAELTIPAKTLTANYTVYVTIHDGTDLFGMGTIDFHVNALPPSLDSITPSYGSYGQMLTATIKGKHTHFVQNQTHVHFGFDSTGTAVNSVNVISDTLLEVSVTIPFETRGGRYTVSITDSIDGIIYKKNGFDVYGMISFTPSAGYPSQTLDVIFSGVHLSSVTANDIKVWFVSDSAISSTILVNSITILNDSSFKVNITIPPNQPAGDYGVNLGIVDGGIAVPQAFYVSTSENCLSHYTTSYNQVNNTFTLRLDSATSKALSFHWDFGDGTTSTAQLPSYAFGSDTLYNVCLSIKTAANDSCTYCHEIGKDSLGNPVLKKKGFLMKVVPYKTVVTEISSVVNSKAEVMLYPNPANHTLTVKSLNFTNNSNRTVLTIYSIEGRLLIQQSDIKDKTEVDISELAKGIYIVEIKAGAKSEILKFSKE